MTVFKDIALAVGVTTVVMLVWSFGTLVLTGEYNFNLADGLVLWALSMLVINAIKKEVTK